MSGETTIDPGAEGKMEIVVPGEDNTVIESDTPLEDVYEAAESDAMITFADSAESEEAESAEEDPAPEGENLEEPTDDPKEEAEPQAAEEQADAGELDPTTLPGPLKEQFDAAMAELEAKKKGQDKYFNTEAQKFAAMKRELDAQLAAARADTAEARNAGPAEAQQGPPPLPTGENITQEQWNEAQTAQSAWFAEQARMKNLEELQQSGQFAPAEELAAIKQHAAVQEVETKVRALPGFSPEAETRMIEMASQSQFWAGAAQTEEGALELANRAIADVQGVQSKVVAAEKAEAKVQKQAKAASQATPRISSPKGAVREDVFANQGYKNENDVYEHAEKMAREGQ